MLDGWLEKAELKPTQPSLAGAWLSLAKSQISQAGAGAGLSSAAMMFPLQNMMEKKLYWVGGWTGGWVVGWLEKAEIKPTQPSLAGAWLSLAITFGNKSDIDPIFCKLS